MLFNSLEFILFFIIVFVLFYLSPHKIRWALLLGASFFFYGYWNIANLFLLLLSIIVVYYTTIQMEKSEIESQKKQWLILNLVINLGILFVFKYFNFFNDSFRVIFETLNFSYPIPNLKLLLPVGISFYTFQALGYSIDVYRGKSKAEKNLGIFALFVSFFPQILAGPIGRSTQLLPQFYQKQTIDYEIILTGLKLVTWGFFKKIVIVDRIAPLVNQVYNSPTEHTGLSLIIATYLFTFQIYCDFSAYSQIAMGFAQILGFDLINNFNQPYSAKSVAEFWKKWHISLSTWFQDYLYIPLGGNRVPQVRFYLNLMIVFLVSALWHGANWTFIIWGALHGIYIISYHWGTKIREKIYQNLRFDRYPLIQNSWEILCTFHLVVLAWIFFRANTVSDAFYIVSHLFQNLSIKDELVYFANPRNLQELTASMLFIIFMIVVETKQDKYNLFKVKNVFLRWSVYYLIIFSLIIFGQYEKTEQFIYFQF